MARFVPKLTKDLEYDRTVEVGDLFRHFKGDTYKVVSVATHTETLEPMVVYRLYHPDKQKSSKIVWVRPMKDFLSVVDSRKYPLEEQAYRFIKVLVKY